MTYSELIAKGYTISAAARRCGVSANHLSLVLRGERRSAKLMAALEALPVKTLVMRERIKNNVTRTEIETAFNFCTSQENERTFNSSKIEYTKVSSSEA